jgi:mannose-6-phosphate isomerase-like protein (cupin superfamily)
MPTQPTVLNASTDLPTETSAELFRGVEHGIDVSFFINHTRPGGGPRRHRHPYPEVFVLHHGEATFHVDGASLTARAGQVIVVPAGATHGFTNTGSRVLEMVSIHPVAEMKGEWMEASS